MSAICANPICCEPFTDLKHGRLFLLPPMEVWLSAHSLSEYCFWLCPECAQGFTMTRYEGEVILVSRINSRYETQPKQLLGPRRVG